MAEFTEAFFDRLKDDQELIDQTAQNAINDSVAAVFTDVPVPKDQNEPYITVSNPVSNSSNATSSSKQTTGINQQRDIRIFDNVENSDTQVESIGWRVFELFHDEPLNVTGWNEVFTTASPPSDLSVEVDDLRGRIVQVQITQTRSA
jgi:hypothetical protein